MKGSTLMGGMLVFAAAFGGALWYAQNYAYYEVEETDRFEIRLTLLDGSTAPLLASGFTILDADTSPLKFRACFKVENSLPMLTENYQLYPEAEPLSPPAWFDCFDTATLDSDLKEGRAVAFLAERDITEGVDRVIAVYPDGRAFAWHQLNEKFAEE